MWIINPNPGSGKLRTLTVGRNHKTVNRF